MLRDPRFIGALLCFAFVIWVVVFQALEIHRLRRKLRRRRLR